MRITRREVMSMATGAATLVSAGAMETKDREGVWVLSDDRNCLTRESAAGYRQLLESVGGQCRAIIVPAMSALSLPRALWLRDKAADGYSVILESGLAFYDALTAERRRAVLSNAFGLHVASIDDPLARVSYLRYRWPADVLVRQFGQATAMSGAHCEPIARWGSIPVSATKLVGAGKITFLGSPIGPLLLAGDREATLLVRQMLG